MNTEGKRQSKALHHMTCTGIWTSFLFFLLSSQKSAFTSSFPLLKQQVSV